MQIKFNGGLVDTTNDYDWTKSSSNLKSLYNEVLNIEPGIQFFRSPNSEYKVRYYKVNIFEKEVPVIFHGKENDNTLAHELLHVEYSSYIDINSIVNTIKAEAGCYSFGNMLFNDNSIYKTLNNFEHILFYPKYLSLGFDKNQFTTDFDRPEVKDMSKLTGTLSDTGISCLADLDSFLICATSFMIFHDKNMWGEEICNLQNAEPGLFDIFSHLRNDAFSLEVDSSITVNSIRIFNRFAHDICDWVDSHFSNIA